jgi:pimeloyl-ACP methyl ester carboxylesterase
MRRDRRSLAVFLIGLAAFSIGSAASASASDCHTLAATPIPATAIALPTRGAEIKHAALEGAGDAQFCKVLGAILPIDTQAPNINFEVNLPNNWNGKALHFGGGGYDGVLVTGLEQVRFGPENKPTPLREGYVTFGSDSGHAGSPADGSFALNGEALDNFAGSQLKKTHDAALALIETHYGKRPARVYFDGNSQGGHEGFIVIQRWPQDYDGVIAIHPVYNFTALQLSGNAIAKALYAPGAWLSPGKLARLQSAVLKACDDLDGAVDGLISNVAGCDKMFDFSSVSCPGGVDAGDTCLSDLQIGVVEIIASPMKFGLKLADGVDGFAKWPILEGGDALGRFNFGKSPTPSEPPKVPNDAFVHVMADQMIRFMVERNPNARSLGFSAHDAADKLGPLSTMIDANSVDIDKFRASGGKLLLMHGTVDMAVTPWNTADYYNRLVGHFGQQKADEFVRFYIAPGFGHGDGAFKVAWDSLATLDAWVERGTPPGAQVIADANPATAGRTRPLCVYPTWPKYKGAGEINDAANFECARE